MPEPVGAQISALAPPEIASQPPACAGVGRSKEASNQRLTGALNGASGSDPALVFAVGGQPTDLTPRTAGETPASRPHARAPGSDYGRPPANLT